MKSVNFVIAAGFGICVFLGLAQELSQSTARGREIYFTGISPHKSPITATLGNDPESIPASTFPCVNCHTFNGRGKAEGGIIPSDITWEELTKPYQVALSTGRKRGPYTEHSIGRAITMGIDSSGNTLGAAMPRFQMSQADLADLIVFLKVLGNDTSVGLSTNSIRIGVILPPARLVEMHDAVNSVLRAYFDELNRQGGIFRRQIEMVTLDCPESMSSILDFLAAQNVFAFTSSFVAGREEELTPIFAKQGIPLIAAFTLNLPSSASPAPSIFYLNDGISGEAEALATFAEKLPNSETAKMVILHADTALSRELADTVERVITASGLPAPARVSLPADSEMLSATQLQMLTTAYRTLFLLAPVPHSHFIFQNANGAGSPTTFLVPGIFASSGIFPERLGHGSRVFIAVSPSHQGLADDGREEYRRLSQSHRLSASLIDDQWTALAGAKLLVEGLRRSGRNLDRATLVESLEGLSNFDTDFAPPLTFGPNRHAGRQRTRVMKVDPDSGQLLPADAD